MGFACHMLIVCFPLKFEALSDWTISIFNIPNNCQPDTMTYVKIRCQKSAKVVLAALPPRKIQGIFAIFEMEQFKHLTHFAFNCAFTQFQLLSDFLVPLAL